MSSGPRLPLPEARDLAARLAGRWGLAWPDAILVGSVRRGVAEVGDLEWIAPLPEAEDALYRALAADVETWAPPLFAGVGGPKIGRELLGLTPGFKRCAVAVRHEGREVRVEINRYVPGPQGNRGWTELRCTGPEEFGRDLLTCWKHVQGTAGTDTPGSANGHFVDREGRVVPTPTELHVCVLARCLWIRPEWRRPDTLLCIDWLSETADGRQRERAIRAMQVLGINRAEALRRFESQDQAVRQLTAGKGDPSS